MTTSFAPSPELDRRLVAWQRKAGIAGLLLLVLSIIGAFFQPVEFFRSYLFGYLFWIGAALGSLALVMVQYLTGGAWGVVTRRTFESASRTLPLLALFFVPIAFGIRDLYPWSHPDLVAGDDVMRHRSVYMNTPWFLVRAVAYFAIWLTITYFLNKWSAVEDEHGGQQDRLETLSAPGLILYVFTVTFAAVDWAESLFPHFFSTMWGFLFVASQGLTAIGFAIFVASLLSHDKPMSEAFHTSHLHDLGKLLLMFVMLWAYFSFSQLLIIWSGNLTTEIPWYAPRWHNSWAWIGIALVCLEFFVPFLLLLSRRLKRTQWMLLGVVGLLLFMRLVDLYWLVMPDFYRNGLRLHWLQFCVPLALGSLWISAFLWQLRKRPLLPLQAPNLQEALHHGG